MKQKKPTKKEISQNPSTLEAIAEGVQQGEA
jgi:hypothetical protein